MPSPEIPEDGVRLGERASVVEHDRRHAQRGVERAQDRGPVRAVVDRQLAPLVAQTEVGQKQAHLVAVSETALS